MCEGGEATLLDCPRNTVGDHNCVHSEDVGVICQGGANNDGVTITNGDFRIVLDGMYENSGRLEYNNGGDWGTVCDDYFNQNSAGA